MIFVAVFVLSGTILRAQVTVVATAATMGPTVYPTLNDAFIAINAGTHQGIIGIGISANTTEVGPCQLNGTGQGPALYTSITINPIVDGVSISGPTTTGRGLIELKGTDNVIIDGDNPNTAGINRNLSITNTATNLINYTSCIRVANVAAIVTTSDNITIQNCILTGSATGRNAAGNTSVAASENTTFGIYVGGNGGTTATDAPAALNSVTANTLPTASTVNAFLVSNNAITSCARAVVFNGANAAASTGVTISNNVIGTSGTLTGVPPFTTPASTVYTKGIWINGTNAITISGNTIQNLLSYVATPLSGIELVSAIGSGTILISNNTVNGICNNATGTSPVRAIVVLNAGAPYTISGNNITNVQGILSGFGAATTTVGIEASTSAASGIIESNKITQVYNRNPNTTAAYGINVTAGSNVTIRNNFVSDIQENMTGGAAFDPQYCIVGIRINAGTGHRIYYNSVNLYGTMLGTANTNLLTSCVAIPSTVITGVDIRNNILSNTITGGTTGIAHVSLYIPSGATSSFNLTLNNNMYYCGTNTASQGIAQAGLTPGVNFYLPGNFNPAITTPATNLRAYTSTLSTAGTNDNASGASSVAAPFTTTSDLHINPAAPNVTDVDAKAVTIAGITLDIDGNTRNVTTPDIGGDEFSALGCVTASGGTISPTTYTLCSGLTQVLTATGATSEAGITYQWKVGTTSGGPYSNVVGGSGATTNSYTTGTLATGVYYYVFEVTCASGPVIALSNEVTVTVNPTPTVTVSPTNANYCAGNPVTLTGSGAATYGWGPAAGLSAVTGTSVTASPTVSTTYTVVGTTAAGCFSSATTTIIAAPSPTGVTASPASPAICNGGSTTLNAAATPYTVTLLSENFNAPANSWTTINLSTGGTPANAAWTLRPNGYSPGGFWTAALNSNDNSQFYLTNSDAQGSGSTTNTILQSPAINTVGFATLNLSFFHYYRFNQAPDSANIEVSTDGVNWTRVQQYLATVGTPTAFVPGNVNLNAYVGFPALYIRFHYRAPWGYGWAIDNVSVVGGSSAFTYSWTSTPVGFTSTAQNPTGVAPSTTTTYTVQVTNSFGCAATASTSITVNPLPTVVANSTATAVCAGSPVTLSGSGATSYTWTGSVTDNVAFNPSTTDTYTVTGTDANGCQNTDNVTVTVNPLPAVVANASSTAICMGDQVTLTGSGATSYTWTNSVIDGVPFSPTITDVYTVTGTDANGCQNTDNTSVTVNTLPTVVANATASAVCDGSPVTLFGSGAVSFTWTGSVSDNIAFTPLVTDTYTVTGTDGNGCVNTDNITVTVNTLPTVVANATATTICEGSPVTLSGSGASTYTWTGSVTDNVAFNPTVSDTYTVTGTDGNGCQNSDNITVTVNPLPVITISFPMDTICYNAGVITLAGASPAGGTWSGPGVFGSSFDPQVAGLGWDMITYSYTDANSCTGTLTDSINVDVCNGIAPVAFVNNVTVYPNPNLGQFTIELSAVPQNAVSVELTNSLGQLVDSFTLTSTSKQIDISHLDSGIYMIRVIDGNNISVHRVVKQ